ncbi:TlpA family protein disulfide reductase [Priestia aryabhattai]|uniref:TlpA family protein disulfide reductase n=1 Tax=Priestia aryabhattai TaxID=412384 RepID=UPI001C0BAFD7|nr:TlpA disulfide reductase family protein [Priestia aryabhattai]MBU3569130.1 TlpA family protein disulfide reductase [Priestia aryabhattai]WDL87238.1 TlpA family protein disulfide reductase [Priestia aryabhattai]
MVKKIIAVLLLVGFLSYALWQGLSSNEASDSSNLSEYKDLNIKKSNSARQASGQAYGLKPKDTAPPFTLSDTNGKSIQLADFKGKKVILNFWATWCPPCQKEMPDMQAFYEKYGNDVQLLAVNLTSSEGSKQAVSKFLKEKQFTFRVLLDDQDSVGSKKYRVSTIPTSYFIDEEGKIVQRVNGPMTIKQMETFAQQAAN